MTELEVLQSILVELQAVNASLERLHFLAVVVSIGVGFISGQIAWALFLGIRDERGVWGEIE